MVIAAREMLRKETRLVDLVCFVCNSYLQILNFTFRRLLSFFIYSWVRETYLTRLSLVKRGIIRCFYNIK